MFVTRKRREREQKGPLNNIEQICFAVSSFKRDRRQGEGQDDASKKCSVPSESQEVLPVGFETLVKSISCIRFFSSTGQSLQE